MATRVCGAKFLSWINSSFPPRGNLERGDPVISWGSDQESPSCCSLDFGSTLLHQNCLPKKPSGKTPSKTRKLKTCLLAVGSKTGPRKCWLNIFKALKRNILSFKNLTCFPWKVTIVKRKTSHLRSIIFLTGGVCWVNFQDSGGLLLQFQAEWVFAHDSPHLSPALTPRLGFMHHIW